MPLLRKEVLHLENVRKGLMRSYFSRTELQEGKIMNCRELHKADDILMNAYRKFFEFMTNEGRNEFCLNWYEYTEDVPKETSSNISPMIFKDGMICLSDYTDYQSGDQLSERFDVFNEHIRKEIENTIRYYKDEIVLGDILDNLEYDKNDIGLNDEEIKKLSSVKTYDSFMNTAYDILDDERYNLLDGTIRNIRDNIDIENFCVRIQFVLEPDPEEFSQKVRFSVNVNTEAPYFRSPGQILKDVGSQILQGRSREVFAAATSQEFYVSEPFDPLNAEERLKASWDFDEFLNRHAPSESIGPSF